ncbi:MAG TPA: AAA family ATPase [Actinomycetota bacterium]
MSDLPTGTVTFLFTDIEGSTRLLQDLGPGYRRVQDRHDELLLEAIQAEGGRVVRIEGDSAFSVFVNPTQAVRAAVAAQRSLAREPWPHGEALRVRMGLHTGEGTPGGGDYVGIDVNRAARIAAAGHGGQVLLSEATRGLIDHALPEGVIVRDLGTHRLKDIDRPERLHDLVVEGLPADFPPLRTLDHRSTNLPAERSSFVGREGDLARIEELLAGSRLVTLVGPGGIGKTRMALRAAAQHLDRFDDGVFLVDLSGVASPDLVPSAIAASLRIPQEPSRELLDSIAERLRERSLLLVLDNFEHVVAAAPSVEHLLGAAPELRVLATSRLPLGLAGEQEYPVEPLPLPGPDEAADVEALTVNDSVKLFVDRAAQVHPGFAITGRNAAPIGEIVSRLDGLPLAIELAASRMKVLSPSELLGRLGRRLPLLTGGARGAPERHRTLRAAIEWSHELLESEERRLFARLAVFAGGWTLESAEEVCGAGLRIEVLQGLSSLVDQSLVGRGHLRDEGTRFRMLETIREFAAERLATSGEESDIRRRHGEWMRDLALEAGPHLVGPAQARWLARLETEHGNLRAALEWAEATGDAETGLRIAASVWRFWHRRGHLDEAMSRLTRLLAMPQGQRRDAVRARALGALGGIAYWQADYGAMGSAYEEAVEIARELGDRDLEAHALFDAAFIPVVKNDHEGMETAFQAALRLAEEVGDRSLQANAWAALARGRLFGGRAAEAADLLHRAISLRGDQGDPQAVAEDYEVLAHIEGTGGAMARAKTHIAAAMRLHLAAGNVLGLALSMRPLAILASIEGEHGRAVRLLGASARLLEDVGGISPPMGFLMLRDVEATARDALGAGPYRRAWEDGYASSFDDAVAMAMVGLPETP